MGAKQFMVRDQTTGSTGYIEADQAGLSLPVVSSSQLDTSLGIQFDAYYDNPIYATKKAALDAAIAAVTVSGTVGSTVRLSRRQYTLDGPVTVPAWVNLVGVGKRTATRFLCTTADAGLNFASRGSTSGYFTVDANNVATQPFLTTGVKRTFIDIDVRNSAGDSFVFENAQNCVSMGLMADVALGSCYVLRNGASANVFYGCDCEQWTRYAVEQFQASGSWLSPNPNYNYFNCGVWERPGPAVSGVALGFVYASAGSVLCENVVLGGAFTTDQSFFISEIVAPGTYCRVQVSNCHLQDTVGNRATALETRSAGAEIVLTGRNDIQAHKYAWKMVDGSVGTVVGRPVYTSINTRFINGSGTKTYDQLVRTQITEPLTISRPAATDTLLSGQVDGGGYSHVWRPDGLYFMDGVSFTPTSFPSVKAGTGSPEGVVSARIGSLYLRIDGGSNTAVYKKESGTGTTGWVPITDTQTTIDVQVFTANGTWNKPANATQVAVIAMAGGGGGGSGRRGAAASVRCGGGGGGGGGVTRHAMPGSTLGATVAVTVGAGGVGGAAVTADSTDGATGAAGGTSSFGTYARATAGTGGGGGTAAAGTAGGGGLGTSSGGAGAAASGTGGAGGNAGNTTIGPPGGGSGAGITSADAVSGGGVGRGAVTTTGSTTVAGANGLSQPANSGLPGDSGGGGDSSIVAAAMAGGNGGIYGAAGGGGGASLNANNSGAGGAGANGIVIVIST